MLQLANFDLFYPEYRTTTAVVTNIVYDIKDNFLINTYKVFSVNKCFVNEDYVKFS